MDVFVAKHEKSIRGVLWCFDRVLFHGYVPLMSGCAMAEFLQRKQIQRRTLKAFLLAQVDRVKKHALAMAATAHCPHQYLTGPTREEDLARQLAERDGITKVLPLFLAFGLAGCIFVIDLMTPLGAGEWIAYLIPVLIASRSADGKRLPLLSLVSTVFVILGFVWSRPGVVSTELAAINRSLGVGVLWVATALIVQRARAEREQARLEAALRRSELMSALGSLVVAVAHEVRNPVFGISATLDAFEARFGPDPAFAEYLKVLRTEVNRMTQLTRDLLEYGRPQPLVVVPSAIADIIADAAATCARRAKETGVEIVTRIAAGTSAVRVDPQRLRQVFENLIQNAVQHSRPGGAVAVEVDDVRRGDEMWVQCAVKDSGDGFRPEDLPRVFEPFFSRRPGGTGLGLSIAQRIVEEHGGTISAQNDPAGGAHIEMRFPAGV